jgi:hypothetical protein
MSSEREGRNARGADVPPAPTPQRSVGTRTLTQRIARKAGPAATAREQQPATAQQVSIANGDDPFGFHLDGAVQLQASTEVNASTVQAHAQRGVAGVGQALPHLDAVQAAFGHHDLAGARAHVGGPAAHAARDMGAHAYATGNDIAFAAAPDLHMAAHEAAHVIQQRAGVQLYGGVGEVGDPYERHADQVADGVVAGRSVEALLDTMSAGARVTATPSVQRSPAAEAGTADGPNIVDALIDPQAKAEAYAARHWRELREAARAALLAANLAWEPPLRWASGSATERGAAALAILWPVVFVPAAWDAAFTRDVDEAIELGLASGRARQAQVTPDDARAALARYYPAVGTAVGNTLVHRLQRSMRMVGAEYVTAHERAGGGYVDTHSLPVTGVSDRAAVAMLEFVRVATSGERARAKPQPTRDRHRRPPPPHGPDAAVAHDRDADAADATVVERSQEQLVLIAGLVGDANVDALAPAYSFLADGPSGSAHERHEGLIRQSQRLELIRGEVLTLIAISHRDVPLALKADAVAAYGRAAGGAHLPEADRLLRLARDEVAELDRRNAMSAARGEADAIEARDPARIATADLDALDVRSDRATRGGGRPTEAHAAAPPIKSSMGALTAGPGGAGADTPSVADDARASRVSAFRHGALRLADTLADTRNALASARELLITPFTFHIALEVEALESEIAGVEALLHELIDDVDARAGRSGVAVLEDAIVAEAEARFREFIKTSGVMELGRRVHAMLERVERAHAIVVTVGFALVMIGASVAGGLAGAYVGGAVRGALTPTALAATGETTTLATAGGVVAGLGTESLIVGGTQAALAGDSFVNAAGENMLAAGFTFGALTSLRWARVLTRAKATWADGAAARFLGAGATDLAVGMGANVVAQSLVHPDAPASDDQLVEWTTAATSMVIGRWIGSRLTSLHDRLDTVGQRFGRDSRRLLALEQLHGELRALEHELPTRAWTPDEYSALIDTRITPLVERIGALEGPAPAAQHPAHIAHDDATTVHVAADVPPTRAASATGDDARAAHADSSRPGPHGAHSRADSPPASAEPSLPAVASTTRDGDAAHPATAGTAEVASVTRAADATGAGARTHQSHAKPDLDAPPRLAAIEHVTGVAKGPAYEQAMTELRAFYAAQEVEAQQVTLTRGHVVDGPYYWDYGNDARRFGHGAIHITFRVHVTPAPGVDATQLAHLRQQVVAGVDQHYNFRPAAGGDRLHLDVEFIDDPTTAHLRIWARPGDGSANLYNWFVDGDPTTHAHEVTHGAFGAPDEYVDPARQAPGRLQDGDANVHTDGSLMGDYWSYDAAGRRSPAPGTGLRTRHWDHIRGQLPAAGSIGGSARPPAAPGAARARLAAALGAIHVVRGNVDRTRPPEAGTRPDQTSYYVTDADAERLAQGLADVDGAAVTPLGKGLLLRIEGAEWYFERRSATDLERLAKGAERSQDGLPPPNAFTVTFYGFRGVQTVRGVPWKQLPHTERAAVEADLARNPLLKYGHIGISLDGGKTIHGFTPDAQLVKQVGETEFFERLRGNKQLPAIVGDDTDIFTEAAARAKDNGWDTEIVTATQLLSEAHQADVSRQLAAMEESGGRAHDKSYQFPYRSPGTEGRFFADDKTANCATFPAQLGLPIPEASGRLSEYIPALQRWAGEGPIDLRLEHHDGN